MKTTGEAESHAEKNPFRVTRAAFSDSLRHYVQLPRSSSRAGQHLQSGAGLRLPGPGAAALQHDDAHPPTTRKFPHGMIGETATLFSACGGRQGRAVCLRREDRGRHSRFARAGQQRDGAARRADGPGGTGARDVSASRASRSSKLLIELEGHPDNAVPSFLGGFAVCAHAAADPADGFATRACR